MIQQLGYQEGQVFFKCPKCCSIKPERAHHCSVCQRCIRKMDHHCPWINNCVGENNQKFFVLFTVRGGTPAVNIQLIPTQIASINRWSTYFPFSPIRTTVLHRIHFHPFDISGCKSVLPVHQKRVERVFQLFATGHRDTAALPHTGSATVCRLHDDHARHPAERNMDG